MINRNDILDYLKQSHERFRSQYGVKRIGIFGSFAQGKENVHSSDIDIIVEMQNPSFDKYMDLKFELEDQFRKPVDLVLKETLKDRLKPVIEKETVYA